MVEKELIRRIQAGDTLAFERLIVIYYPAVLGYFFRNTRDHHLSKDLTQEVFIKVAAGIGRYRHYVPFKNWLFTICSNHLKNHWRTLSRVPDFAEMTENTVSHDQRLDEIAVKTDIASVLQRLPAEQREAVVLRFYGEFTIREIAKITGAKETTVKARIRYALEKLKHELEGYEDGRQRSF